MMSEMSTISQKKKSKLKLKILITAFTDLIVILILS